MKMMKFASEKAMALVDGQLAPAEAPAVIHEIARTPELMRQVQKYLAVHPRQIQELYQDIAVEPVPDYLTETVLKTAMGQAPRRQSAFSAKLRDFAARTREKYSVPGWSLAAGPALAGALVAVSAYMFMPTASVGAYADAGTMVPPLEEAVGESRLVFKPILTFRNKADEVCRQFQLQYGDTQSSHAVACHKATGSWQMMMATAVAPIAPNSSPSLASVADRKPADDYVDATIAGRAIEGEQEKSTLARIRTLRLEALAAKKAAEKDRR